MSKKVINKFQIVVVTRKLTFYSSRNTPNYLKTFD